MIRREFLYLPGLALMLPAMSQVAQAQPVAPKLVQIVRKDLEGQGQLVQETVVNIADFGPGSASPWHMHPGAQELLFVTDGSLTLEVDGQGAKVINAGEGGIIPANVPISCGTRAQAWPQKGSWYSAAAQRINRCWCW